MTFQAFRGSSGAQIAFTILLATSIGDRVTQCTAHERGVANAVKVGQNHFFLENKVVINFDFRHGAKKSGHLDHPLQSYGQIYFNIFRYILRKAGLLWLSCLTYVPSSHSFSRNLGFSSINHSIANACLMHLYLNLS